MRLLGEDSGRHAVRGLIDEIANEILRLRNDASALRRRTKSIARRGAAGRERHAVNPPLEVGLGAIAVGVVVGHDRALDDRLNGDRAPGVLDHPSQFMHAPRAEVTHGRSGEPSH